MVMSGEDTGHDCTVASFEAWSNGLARRLMEHEPRVCDSVACDLGERTMRIDVYGQQVNRLLLQWTLLADYKALAKAEAAAVADRAVEYVVANVMDGSADGLLTVPSTDLVEVIRESVLYAMNGQRA